jgi:hypothetical protein
LSGLEEERRRKKSPEEEKKIFIPGMIRLIIKIFFLLFSLEAELTIENHKKPGLPNGIFSYQNFTFG